MKSNGKRVLSVLVVLLALTIVWSGVGCGEKEEPEAKVYTFICSNIFPPTSPYTTRWQAVIAEIEQRSNGQIVIEDNPGATLVPRTQSLEALRSGLIDLDVCGSNYCEGYPFTRAGIGGMPYLVRSAQDAGDLLYNKGLWEVFRDCAIDKAGIIEIGAVPGPSSLLAFAPGEDVRYWSDMAGKKMLVAVGFGTELFKAAGATPVPGIATGDIYMAMQTGLVDGFEGGWYMMDTYGLGEVTGSVTLPYIFNYGSIPINANIDKWNELPEDLQQLVYDVFKEKFYVALAEMLAKEDELMASMQEKYGITVNYFSETEVAKIEEMRATFVQSYLEKTGEWGDQALTIVEDYYGKSYH